MKLITNNFRTHAAKQFVESLSEPQNTIYYVGAHRSVNFPNDAAPPNPTDDIGSTFYDMYDELLFGKRVISTDVTHMARNIPWSSNTVYEMYDSRAQDLANKDFFVVAEESGSYHVFKCLNNNDGAPSTSKPLRSEVEPEDEFYRKPDGYEWKYMYSITASEYQKFATAEYIPIVINANVVAAAASGSIDTMIIDNPGSNYKSYAIGNIKESAIAGNNLIFSLESSSMTLSANDSFYENCSIYIEDGAGDGEIRTITDYFTSGGERRILVDRPFDTMPARNSIFKIAPRVIISGDGQNATARAEVNTSTGAISDIVIISRGSDYTYASVEVIGNTGSTSASSVSSAIVRPVISPPGGHGSDPINELYGSKVGISVAFAGTEANTIPATNDFRKISLIKDPLFADVDLVLNSTSEVFQAGETVTQASTGATAKIVGRNSTTMTLTNVRGFFAVSNASVTSTAIVGSSSSASSYIVSIDRTFNTFDQRTIFTTQITDTGLPSYGTFALDETVVQSGLLQLQSNVVKLTLAGSAYTFIDGESVTQANTGATGVVSARFDDVLSLVNTSGFFVTGSPIVGANTATPVNVTKYDNTFAATATGTIHQVQQINANTSIIALTNVIGSFLLSDAATNTINTFKGQTSQAVASLIGIDDSKNKLVDGSGEILYVENFIPITRNSSQTERIKLIIEF